MLIFIKHLIHYLLQLMNKEGKCLKVIVHLNQLRILHQKNKAHNLMNS